ncbi:MAG: hypothetical protein ABSG68_05145 [Thermoguttaceae bacterium]|jgi:hypothetical protein
MPDPRSSPCDQPPPPRWALGLLCYAASLWITLALLIVYVVVLGWATCLETWYGSAAAQFGIYGAWWFTALGVLLGLNVFCALLVRYPWPKSRTGFVLTHVGLLVLLVGCLVTRRTAIDAVLAVAQGQSASTAYEESRQHFELTTMPTARGDPSGTTIAVPFRAGPFNWDDYGQFFWFPWRLAGRDRGLIYDRDAVRLEVLDYYADSQSTATPHLELRIAAADAAEGAATIALGIDSSGHPHAAGRPFGMGTRRTLPGGQRVVFWMTGSAEETAAFRQSRPDGPLGRQGRLVLSAGGNSFQWPVDALKPGIRQPLGKTGFELELLSFDPRFQGLKLQIHHGKDLPQPMFLFADFPELNQHDNHDRIFGAFWYVGEKPAGKEKEQEDSDDDSAARQALRPRIDILQGADGKLYYRTWQPAAGGSGSGLPLATAAAVLPGNGTPVAVFPKTADAASLAVQQFIPAPKPGRLVEPLPFSKKKAQMQEHRARVRLTVDDTNEEFWLTQWPDDPRETPPPEARKVVAGRERQVALVLRPDEIRMGLDVHLRKFRRKLDPGSSQESAFSSLVDFLDRQQPGRHLAQEVLITMNVPADVADPQSGRSYRLFQSGFFPPQRPTISYLTVNSDPGRGLKYAGCLLVVIGIFVNYFLRRGIDKTG